MTTHALIPLKHGAHGKSRLAGVLPPRARAQLIRTMLGHVASCLTAIPEIERVSVVTAQRAAVPEGCQYLADSGRGLNAALASAAAQLTRQGATGLLIIAADVPFVSREDIEALLHLAQEKVVLAAADSSGSGTNALLLTPPQCIAPRFGPGSLQAHEAAAGTAGLGFVRVDRPGLAVDIDEPGQLELLVRSGQASYGFLAAALRSSG